MRVIPAVDIREGKCVRLLRGEKGSEQAYGGDPVSIAKRWEREGATELHVVDLDAAFGEGRQDDLVTAIVRAVSIPVQVGGGVRSFEDFVALSDAGASRIVFGTVAVEQPEVVEKALAGSSARVVIGVDVKDGAVATRGWVSASNRSPLELGRSWVERGVSRFVYTEVSRDGLMEGLDVEATRAFARETGVHVIASGGIGTLDHLRLVKPLASAGIEAVIVGKALYEGAFTLAAARELLAD